MISPNIVRSIENIPLEVIKKRIFFDENSGFHCLMMDFDEKLWITSKILNHKPNPMVWLERADQVVLAMFKNQ